MIRPPPTSPLFPYTTLFRSSSRTPGSQPLPPHREIAGCRIAKSECWPPQPTSISERRQTAIACESWVDRKSTRLNSSHPSISYAVFCLKKKNQTDIYHRSH